MNKLLKIITHAQVLSVVAAFAIMVFLSYHFMSNIERKHLLHRVDIALANAQEKIRAELLEPKATHALITETIRSMIVTGRDFESVKSYIKHISNYLTASPQIMLYTSGIYGIFYVYDNVFFSGMWHPPTDFDFSSRPWYTAITEAEGNFVITQPYIDARTGTPSLTFVRRILDDEGRPLAVICLDVSMDRIRNIAVDTYVTDSSYGVLFDNNFYVLAHPVQSFVGRDIRYLNYGIAIKQELLETGEIFNRRAMDYNGNDVILFARQLENGWYMAIIAYSRKYFQSLMHIAKIFILLGIILASILSAILLSIIARKNRAEERIKIMLDATPLAINILNERFENIDCSLEALKLFGISTKKEYITRYNELSPEYQTDGQKSMEKREAFLKKAFEEGYCNFEWTHRDLNGNLIQCDVMLIRVKLKKAYMVCEYVRDIREMKAVMAKMREADECTQVLFNATPLSCLMIDNNSKVIECNEETLRLFGFSDKMELIARVAELSPQRQPNGALSANKFLEYIDEAFEDGYSHFEWMHQKLNGEMIPTEVFLVRVKFRGEYAVAVYIRDLRELKAMIAEMQRAEIAEGSSRTKSEFLAKMSHEIRTPMNAILGITEIQLQNDSLPPETKEALGRIYNSGDLLLGIINDILDLSKIEAGKLELVNAQYDVASLLHDVVQLNMMRYESKPIEFKLNVDKNIPSILIGDELRLKQILNNILSNAFKYTQEGLVTLSVSVLPKEREEDGLIALIFCVKDTGQGMTEEQVKKMGDMYSRFNLDVNRAVEGTGLGMNITKTLVQMMNGEISIESTPGVGSEFTVYLPQVDAGFDCFGEEWAENLEQLNLSKTIITRNALIVREYMPYGKVLVVDDVETNLYVARGLLAPYGLSIDTVLSGFDAIAKIEDGAVYDIIFMDHMMPKMDGIETVRRIRETGYSEPVIALTANALAGHAEMFLSNGFDDFISKPVDIRQLNLILNTLIRDKQPVEVLEEASRSKNDLELSARKKIIQEQGLSEIFIRDAEKAAAVLEVIQRNKCRRGDDVSLLIINTHAMKSALANIGERELSEFALKLEDAGREHNTDAILNGLPVFLDALKNVIKTMRAKNEDKKDNAEYEDTEEARSFLRENLIIIQAACARYDKKTVKDVLTELRQKKWPMKLNERFANMAELLLHSEFEEITNSAEEILSNGFLQNSS